MTVPAGDLRVDELRPTGGSWTGLLFENAPADHALALTWTFTIDFAEVNRDYGSVSPNLVVDWVPAGSSTWRSMGGQRFAVDGFSAPIEASLYFFQHHRYDRASILVQHQDAERLDVAASVTVDLDGLGIDELSARATLTFGGIYVQTDATGNDPDAAAALLDRFTDTSGLVARSRSHNVVFEPAE